MGRTGTKAKASKQARRLNYIIFQNNESFLSMHDVFMKTISFLFHHSVL